MQIGKPQHPYQQLPSSIKTRRNPFSSMTGTSQASISKLSIFKKLPDASLFPLWPHLLQDIETEIGKQQEIINAADSKPESNVDMSERQAFSMWKIVQKKNLEKAKADFENLKDAFMETAKKQSWCPETATWDAIKLNIHNINPRTPNALPIAAKAGRAVSASIPVAVGAPLLAKSIGTISGAALAGGLTGLITVPVVTGIMGGLATAVIADKVVASNSRKSVLKAVSESEDLKTSTRNMEAKAKEHGLKVKYLGLGVENLAGREPVELTHPIGEQPILSEPPKTHLSEPPQAHLADANLVQEPATFGLSMPPRREMSQVNSKGTLLAASILGVKPSPPPEQLQDEKSPQPRSNLSEAPTIATPQAMTHASRAMTPLKQRVLPVFPDVPNTPLPTRMPAAPLPTQPQKEDRIPLLEGE